MVSRDITIDSVLGIHLRPAGAMCEEAVKYNSKIYFEYGEGKTANAKSVIRLTATGEDEQKAIEAVTEAVTKSLKED